MNQNFLEFPLYHGTSSIFLKSIIENGLGGCNPIVDLKLFEFANDLWPYINDHLADENAFVQKSESYRKMIKQQTGYKNYQHGDVYISPSKNTAIRYAANKKYGSEILTYSLDFLEELVRRIVPGVRDELFQNYRQIFNFLDISPSPLLIQIQDLGNQKLLTENGEPGVEQIRYLNDLVLSGRGLEILGQQKNFRLTQAVPVENLKIWMLTVLSYDPFNPKYQIVPLDIENIELN